VFSQVGLSVFIQSDPQVKKDAVGRLDFYDSDGRLIVKGLPTKVKMRPGTLFFTTWTLAIDQLPPDLYRRISCSTTPPCGAAT
jgi:hypothetical protein